MKEPYKVPIDQAQLFLDDDLIQEADNVTRVWHRLEKHPANPLILRSEPEENLFLFGTVINDLDPLVDDEVYRMWYFARGQGSEWVAYARSRDGLRWEKPDLRDDTQREELPRNAVLKPEGWRLLGLSGVVRDRSAGNGRSYKLMIPAADRRTKEKTYLMAESEDGYDWNLVSTFTPERPSNPDRACFTWDPHRQLYALYNRYRYGDPDLRERGGPAYWGRAIALCTSRDFREWSSPELVLHAETDEPDGTELYGMGAYPYAGQWVGLVQVHRSLPHLAYIDLAIAHSRDGQKWDREPDLVLPRGGVGEWDRFNQCASTQLVREGDEIRVYYSGRLYRHGEYSKFTDLGDSGPKQVGIGLATIRLDGWCSMEASFDGGCITTVPLQLPTGGEMYLNAASEWGEIMVEILDAEGQSILRSEPATSDSVRLPVIWPDRGGWHALNVEPVRIRFALKNAKLFSWSVLRANPTAKR